MCQLSSWNIQWKVISSDDGRHWMHRWQNNVNQTKWEESHYYYLTQWSCTHTQCECECNDWNHCWFPDKIHRYIIMNTKICHNIDEQLEMNDRKIVRNMCTYNETMTGTHCLFPFAMHFPLELCILSTLIFPCGPMQLAKYAHTIAGTAYNSCNTMRYAHIDWVHFVHEKQKTKKNIIIRKIECAVNENDGGVRTKYTLTRVPHTMSTDRVQRRPFMTHRLDTMRPQWIEINVSRACIAQYTVAFFFVLLLNAAADASLTLFLLFRKLMKENETNEQHKKRTRTFWFWTLVDDVDLAFS